MAKTKLKAKAKPALTSREDCDEAIRKIGDIRGALALIQQEFDEQLREATEGHEKKAAPLNAEVNDLFEAVQTFCETHRPALAGDSKTIEFAAGKACWRKDPDKVVVDNADEAADSLIENGEEGYVDTVFKIDKARLKKNKTLLRDTPGVRLVDGEEKFSVEPIDGHIEGA